MPSPIRLDPAGNVIIDYVAKEGIAMLLDQFNLLREIEPPKGLTSDDLFSAVDHLVKAVRILEECRTAMEEVFRFRRNWNFPSSEITIN
jgi:hypothetical protein